VTAPIFQSSDAKAVRKLLDKHEGFGAVDETRVDGKKVTVVAWFDYSLKDEEAIAAECLAIYRNGRRVSGQPLRVTLQSTGLAAYVDWEIESLIVNSFGGQWVVPTWNSEVNPFALFPRFEKYVVPAEHDPDQLASWRNAVVLAAYLNSQGDYGTLLRSLEDQRGES